MAYETEDHETQYCFPTINSSCIKTKRSTHEYNFMYVFFSLLSVWTVFLNLLVIISVSHYKKLHTPSNMLILSLAVSDLLIGLIVIPVEAIQLIEACWYFGDIFCGLFLIIMAVLLSTTLNNLGIIAVDRFLAREKHLTTSSVKRKSESKAALTLGIIVVIHLVCWLPVYICFLPAGIEVPVPVTNTMLWTVYCNSGLNPVVYALFYPWFRKSVKHILSLNIFRPSSSLINNY
nr:trace amine-associated receptor 13c-like [Misgurnus anguillicaudatus]